MNLYLEEGLTYAARHSFAYRRPGIPERRGEAT